MDEAKQLTKEEAAKILGFEGDTAIEDMENTYLGEDEVPPLCSVCIMRCREDEEDYDENFLIEPTGTCEHGFPSIIHDC